MVVEGGLDLRPRFCGHRCRCRRERAKPQCRQGGCPCAVLVHRRARRPRQRLLRARHRPVPTKPERRADRDDAFGGREGAQHRRRLQPGHRARAGTDVSALSRRHAAGQSWADARGSLAARGSAEHLVCGPAAAKERAHPELPYGLTSGTAPRRLRNSALATPRSATTRGDRLATWPWPQRECRAEGTGTALGSGVGTPHAARRGAFCNVAAAMFPGARIEPSQRSNDAIRRVRGANVPVCRDRRALC
mmetsp:Transcript_46594/g.134217  ORF Transcript_46594/g.134217 Transcript_46594/m.134217 type:complete len:248 (+) Transcript_46594:414-1157(+)